MSDAPTGAAGPPQRQPGVSPAVADVVRAVAVGGGPQVVVLVEGASDQAALEALAQRQDSNLQAEGIAIVPIGGASAMTRTLAVLGPRGLDLHLAGLYDAAEEADVRRGLASAGFGPDVTRTQMEALGFHVCVEDLEDELIRALGVASVEQVIEAQGDLGSFRTFQKQPAQRGRTIEQQLRRFMGTRSGRKIQYARLVVEALGVGHVPEPLEAVLAHARARGKGT